MSENELPPELVEALKNLRSKRGKVVAEHIAKYGYVTTEDIRDYGYNDPYRPTMDLRDEGIPLIDYKVKNRQGRWISAYKFGSFEDVRTDRQGGRKGFSKKFKALLVEMYGSHCAICLDKLAIRYLQIDHRIPYQISGEGEFDERRSEDYMLLCRSCNRGKSWSCENCENFTNIKNSEICKSCYWANPNSYTHVAMRNIRRIDITWVEDEVFIYDVIKEQAQRRNQTIAEYVKSFLKKIAGA